MRVTIGLAFSTALIVGWGSGFAEARVVPLSENLENTKPTFEVLSSSDLGLTLRFELPAVEVDEFEIDGRVFSLISIPDGTLRGEPGRPAVPAIARLISIPDGAAARLRVISTATERLDGIDLLPMQPDSESDAADFAFDEAYYSIEHFDFSPVAQVGEPAILRDLRVVPITFAPVRCLPAENAVEVMQSITVEVDFTGENQKNSKSSSRDLIPSSFDRMYRSLVLNYEGPRDGQRVGNGSYLIITPNLASVANDIQPLLEWRTRMGYPSTLVTTADIGGSTKEDIKAYIQTAYDTWEIPPEYVTLVGDATGATVLLPTFNDPYYGVEGDHSYVLLEGDDILADVHIGRISIAEVDKIAYVADKIVNYETNPYMTSTHWFKAASLIGDPTSSGITCVHVVQWIKQRLVELGYSQIDEWYANNANTFFANTINAGVGIFAYRGFYAMSGIDNSDIAALTNGEMLPFAVELTCGVGSFAQGTSRSEKLFRIGNIGDTRGAIGSIATAGLNTHTRYNNVMMMGIMDGLLYAGVPELGACLAQGKLAIYLNFFENDSMEAETYAVWNNLIGDPATRCWTEVPANVPTVTHPASIPVGATSVLVTVEDSGSGLPVEGACVCLWKDGETHVSDFTDEAGQVDLAVHTPSAGLMKVTVTKWNMLPYLTGVPVASEADHVALNTYQVDDDLAGSSSGNGDGDANPAETVELSVELRNTGANTAHNISVVLTSDDPFVTIQDDSETYGDLAPDATAWDPDDFDVTIDPSCPHGHQIPLRMDIHADEGDYHARLMLPVISVEFAYDTHTWHGVGVELDPAESGEVSIAITNTGGMAGAGVTGELISMSQYLDVTDPTGFFGAVAQGATAENTGDPFGVSASAGAFPGHVAPCLLVLETNSGARETVAVSLRIGSASSTDPLGPDGYGYYAFDNTDTDYPDAPTYN
ncbi:MAG: hypothetical protein KAW17_05470 [Candidatus Eisenbacteria sp.]|nr:hypothetical protein [Candidatus Eisenbacteria bacterium]